MKDEGNIVIAGFGGSLRKGSFSKKVMEKAANLMPAGSELVMADISKIPIFNADLAKEPDESVVKFKKLIEESDGFLIVTPEYNYSVPGFLKNAIDWASVPNNVFAKKIGAIMSSSTGMMGGSRAQYHLRQSFVFLDSRIINRPEVIINSVDRKINEKGEFQDENSEKFMIDLLKNLVSEVKEQRHARSK
ncbi:MAG: NAD(P)H-dependent oxidoreductase [Candidatus Thermoplasmatota archaeon]|jgi:chromate reductase|nr:NAD(P)H-dependent oxidoreductase [Candidatus Thermoplasmatota archaeon]